jgi:hypothetical protein
MNKRRLAIVLIVIVALVSGTWFVLNAVELNNECANQIPEVKIADLKSTSNWETPGGVQAIMLFNITIHNLQDRAVDGLTVDLKIFDINGTVLESATAFFGPGVIGYGAELESFDGILHAGEVREFRGIIMTNWEEVGKTNALVADVKYGNVVLDEQKFYQS